MLFVSVVLLCACQFLSAVPRSPANEKGGKDSAQVTIIAKQKGCTVEVDAMAVGTTDDQGVLVLQSIDPSDHYVHVRCPGEPRETAYFVSLQPAQRLDLQHQPAGSPDTENAVARMKLRDLVKDAVQLRVRGNLDEAVKELREAAGLDPENSDLHRELGITFLLDKDWKRARLEMLEAIRHDPTDADAHNGLGYALEKLGDLDGALKEYRIATRLEPDDSSYRRHYLDAIGKLAAQQGEKKK